MQSLKTLVQGKRILVTGGTGTIGSELVRQLLQYKPNQVRVFSRDEHKQHWMAHHMKGIPNLRFQIGDVRDRERIRKSMEGIDIVFHSAALKHVPACEYNPFEAMQTNVIGTQNVVDAAYACGVERLIAISTDKAAAPLNVMGATKLLAEKIVTGALYHQGLRRTICSAVRFGNVLASRGSVVEVFKEQISKSEPLTITSPKMARFVMTPQDAVSLVLTAATLMQGAEVFILKMPVVRIADLAKALVEIYSPVVGKDPKKAKLIYTGIRPGEKIDELLMTEDEARLALEHKTMFILRPFMQFPELADEGDRVYKDTKRTNPKDYSSAQQKPIAYKQVLEMIRAVVG